MVFMLLHSLDPLLNCEVCVMLTRSSPCVRSHATINPDLKGSNTNKFLVIKKMLVFSKYCMRKCAIIKMYTVHPPGTKRTQNLREIAQNVIFSPVL